MRQSLRLLAPLSASLAIVAAGLSACERQPAIDANDNVSRPIPKSPTSPVSDPAFDREALILAVLRAASAHGTGVDDLVVQRQLDGRQIEVRIRLGCQGPSTETNLSGWSFDAEKRRLRVRAVPDLSLKDPLIREALSDEPEEVEGFWLPRPWLLVEACPRTAPQTAEDPRALGGEAPKEERPPAPIAPATRTARIGLAQIFTDTDDRSRRRSGRAYESALDVPQGEQPGSKGFDLVLLGRLRARPGGRVIHCAGGGADAPPDCIVSADIDHVRIERPEDRTVVAEWRT